MKPYIIYFLILTLPLQAFTQRKLSDANIVGDVKNAKTGEHIPYINISVSNTVIGTSTDGTGHYYLKNLPVGKLTIRISGVGYKTVEKEITTESGKTLEVNFLTEEEGLALNEVVVSANRNETNRKEASVIVGVLSPFVFNATNAVTISQGLNFQPGVRVENDCQNCGFTQVRINGLEGPYSQILIDSRPVFSALSGVYGLEQIPVNMIERVEIVRGGGSALFGSNAIAGTINIITREPLSNTFSIAHNFESIGGKAPDNALNVNTSLVTDDNRAGIYLYGTYRNRQAYDHDDDSFSELPKLLNNAFGFRSYYRLNSQSKLTAEMHNMSEYRRGGDSIDLVPHRSNIAEELKHEINGGSVAYNWMSPDLKQRVNVYASLQNVKRNSYYGAEQDLNAYGLTTNLTAVAGGQYTHGFRNFLFLPADLTTGAEYQYDVLNDESVYRADLDQTTKVLGLFLQNEWKSDKGSVLLGARADKHNMLNDIILSPRLNVKYNLTSNIHWRASYSTGFRAPQAFDEDLHISAVGGEIKITELSPDLRPERSNSFSSSFDLYYNPKNIQSNLLIEGFYTKINDVFVLTEVGTNADGNIIEERHNGSGATVMGVNLEGKIVPVSPLQIQVGYTIQQSLYDEAEAWLETEDEIKTEQKMLRTPNQYGYFSVAYLPVKRLSLNVTGTYTGQMLIPHFEGYINENRLETTPDFFDIGLKTSYDFPLANSMTLQLSGGVKNIFNQYQNDFDKGKLRDAGYIYGPGLPRTLFVGIKIANI